MHIKEKRPIPSLRRSEVPTHRDGNLHPWAVKTLYFLRRPERPWQSPAFERFEIAASAFGLLAITPTDSILTD